MTAARPGNLASLQKAAAARTAATTAIRQRVEQLRARPQARTVQRRDPGPGQPGNVIATLTGELTQLKRHHHEEIAELQHALQAAHGENLILRRRLGQQPKEPATPDR